MAFGTSGHHGSSFKQGLADGIVITPSYYPPDDGGLNIIHPMADLHKVTYNWIEAKANELLQKKHQTIQYLLHRQMRPVWQAWRTKWGIEIINF